MNFDAHSCIDLIKKHPFFGDKDFDALQVTKLGGWSNTSFKLDFVKERFFLRINRRNPFLNIDREVEKANSVLAEQWEIGKRILFTEGDIQVAEFIENEGVVSCDDLKKDSIIHNVVFTLKKMHNSGLKFTNNLNPYLRLLKVYERIARFIPLTFPKEFDLVLDSFRIIFCSDILFDTPKVPCHNDTTPYNMLRTISGVKFVDWEHSGNNDPAWDLAYLSTEAGFSHEDDLRMIQAYNPDSHSDFFVRFSIYKPLTHLWIFIWVYTQLYSKNEVLSSAEFKNVSEKRLSLCLELMNQEHFKESMKLLQKPRFLHFPSSFLSVKT